MKSANFCDILKKQAVFFDRSDKILFKHLKGCIILKIIKASTYIPVSSDAFALPLPLRLELFWANTLLCAYRIDEDKTVDFTYNINTDIPILTPVSHKLKTENIYFLIRSRIFPDAPYTAPMLKQLGLEKYDPYEILMRTHGMQTADCYWIKRSDEQIDFEGAGRQYAKLFLPSGEPEAPQPLSSLENFLKQ